MKTQKVGVKEMVKHGEITAKQALTKLIARANRHKEYAILAKSATFRWLKSREQV